MTTQAKNNKSKINPFKLSNQVKNILHEKGFSKIFNYTDYAIFKAQTKDAFNRAQTIADLFLAETHQQSDLTEYIF